MKKLFTVLLTGLFLLGCSVGTTDLSEAELTEVYAKGKPVKGIYLGGETIPELSVIEVDKGQVSRIFWDASIAPYQIIYCYQLQADGTYKYKYQTSTDGDIGFYISYSDPKIKEPRNRIFLDKGDTIKLLFNNTQEFTQPIPLPSNGK